MEYNVNKIKYELNYWKRKHFIWCHKFKFSNYFSLPEIFEEKRSKNHMFTLLKPLSTWQDLIARKFSTNTLLKDLNKIPFQYKSELSWNPHFMLQLRPFYCNYQIEAHSQHSKNTGPDIIILNKYQILKEKTHSEKFTVWP